jgi:hypothetical protein
MENNPLAQVTLTLTVEEAIRVIVSLNSYATLLRKDAEAAEVANHRPEVVNALVGETNAMTSLAHRIENLLDITDMGARLPQVR